MITVEVAERLIASSRPARQWLTPRRLVLLSAGLVIGGLLAAPDFTDKMGMPGWLVPQFLLLAVIIAVVHTSMKQRQMTERMLGGFEALQLQEWDQALAALEQLLEHPIRQPHARTELLLALGSVAEAQHSYDAAQRIYEAIIADPTANPLQDHTARVALAAVMLRTGHTADAVTLIDRLTRMDLPDPLRAQIELLALFREVTMGQADASIDQAGQRRELFREYLSTRAGFGYALLAAAFDRAEQPESARQYWHDATMLLRPEKLLDRFGELARIAEKYPAAERPI